MREGEGLPIVHWEENTDRQLSLDGSVWTYVSLDHRRRQRCGEVWRCKKRVATGAGPEHRVCKCGVSVVAQRVMDPTSIDEVVGLIPGLTWWVKDPALP